MSANRDNPPCANWIDQDYSIPDPANHDDLLVPIPGDMKSLYLLTFAIALAISRPATAGLRVDEWTVEQDLPQNSVQAIVQSQDGYLWLGTSTGPVRFDGIRSVETLAGQSPPVSQDRVVDLLLDSKGAI